jgi:hypothetical protein
MYRRTRSPVIRVGLAALGLVLAVGCAQEQPIVDRTEAYALSKSLFTGEWYYNQTVIDTPNHGLPGFIPVGAVNYTGAKRIRWDIQEGWLYARKSYEFIKGSTRETVNGGVSNGSGDSFIETDTGEFKGSIVGAWRITSHFDVKRDYNPTTGETRNVVTENASDCKWYECTHFRVDWSKNQAVDYFFVLDYDEDIRKTNEAYSYQDGDDPRFMPIFDKKAGYIDITQAMTLDPGKIRFTWDGRTYEYPLCWLSDTTECNTVTIKLRHSFWRRSPNRDFIARSHNGEITEWFGFFTNDRLIWDNRDGISEKHRQRVINRHNIWVNWHYADQPCKTDADCKTAGSKCDTYTKFYKVDVEKDSDVDGLPDSFEEAVGLNPRKADTDGDGKIDRHDDAVTTRVEYDKDGHVKTLATDKESNRMSDLQDYWKWAAANREFRCTVPVTERTPRPIAYFNTGYFPRELVCDADDQEGTGPCKQWKWTADKKVQKDHNSSWSVVHQVSNNYAEAWWRIYLRGAYGWSQEKLDLWLKTHDPKQFSAEEQAVLAKFGDINDPDGPNGVYAFTICPNNPPQDYDPWPCRFNKMSWEEAKKKIDAGEDKLENRPLVRRGDVRFSKINYVAGYNTGLLGLGPSHTDPITGENFAGVANVYHLNDTAANNVREMVGLLNGTISAKDYIDGVDLQRWVSSVKVKGARGLNFQKFKHADIKSAYAATIQPWMKRVARTMDGQQLNAAHKHQTNTQIKRRLLTSISMFDPAKYSAPGLDLIKGTDIEKRLIDNEILMGSGFQPHKVAEISDDVLNKASLARGGYVKALDAKEQFRRDISARHNMFLPEMADDAMAGLAYRLKDKSQDEVYQIARRIIMNAVLTHEMGHTFGLHHNWTGSEDVINFFPEYWKLRTNNFTEMAACTGPWTRNWDTQQGGFGDLMPQDAPVAGDGKLCPYFIKPITPYQLGTDGQASKEGLKSIYEYSYSSSMDYAGRYTIDGHGLGRYDVAAMMYGHVDKIEVYEDSPYSSLGSIGNGQWENWFREYFENDGDPVLFYTRPKAFHYTQWMQYMGKKAFEDSNRKVVPYDQVVDLDECTVQNVNWKCLRNEDRGSGVCVNKSTLKAEPNAPTCSGTKWGHFYVEGTKAYPRVPYLFCTWTSGDISGNCNTRDFGADTYERMKMLTDSWDTYYPLRNFTRYKHGHSPESYVGRYYRRLYRKLKDFNNIYALYQGLLRTFTDEESIKNFFGDALEGWGGYTLALNEGFNMALRTLAMPDVKGFNKVTTIDGKELYDEVTIGGAQVRTSLVTGRYFTTSYSTGDFERTCGLTWWECLHHIGFYTDKIMSLIAIGDARTYFVGQDTAEDIREYRISFFDNYATQLIDFFGSVLSNEHASHAPIFNPTVASNPSYIDPKGNEWRYGIAWRQYADKTKDIGAGGLPAGTAPIESASRFTLKMYMMVYGFLQFQNNFDNQYVDRSLMWLEGPNSGWDITPTELVEGVVKFVDPFTGYTYVGAKYKDGKGIAQRMIGYANRVKARTRYCNSTDAQAADACQTLDDRAESKLFEYVELMNIQTRLTERFRGWATWRWNPFRP